MPTQPDDSLYVEHGRLLAAVEFRQAALQSCLDHLNIYRQYPDEEIARVERLTAEMARAVAELAAFERRHPAFALGRLIAGEVPGS